VCLVAVEVGIKGNAEAGWTTRALVYHSLNHLPLAPLQLVEVVVDTLAKHNACDCGEAIPAVSTRLLGLANGAVRTAEVEDKVYILQISTRC
jgi:hypothetical protein